MSPEQAVHDFRNLLGEFVLALEVAEGEEDHANTQKRLAQLVEMYKQAVEGRDRAE